MSGDVRLAQCLRTGGFVAVKTLEKAGLTKKQQRVLMREVDIHLCMDHTNIIRLLQVFDEADKVYLVMEYCSGGTLSERLAEKGKLSEKEAALVVYQALSAISYCHGRPSGKVIHRDLKLDNFVYNQKGDAAVLKLLDFGLSRVIAPGGPLLKNAAGTLEFMAPEVLRDEQHGEACDLWAIGVMAYTLLSGKLPFDGSDNDSIESAILQGNLLMNGGLWDGISGPPKAFIMQLLSKYPAERPSADAALLQPWMAQFKTKAEYAPPLSMDVLRGIESFAGENVMRRAAAAIAVYSQIDLEGEDVKLAEKQFRSFDVDGNGAISQEELTHVLQRESGISAERCQWVFEQLDIDGDQEIQRSEFLAAVVGARLLRSHSEIDKAFNHFDLSNDGKIHPRELTGILGETFCGMSTKRVFSEVDRNGDNVIDFDEFSSMVKTSAVHQAWV